MGFVLTILFSAFLLFAIQPLYAKVLLPNYGGGSAVWTACMVFYQSLLLIGYGYAYFIDKKCKANQQKFIHLAFVCLVSLILVFQMATGKPIFTLPTTPSYPFVDVFLRLFETIGLPYLLLSTSAPLLQAWYSEQFISENAYKLYGASNIGAFLALFLYPLSIEPSFDLSTQYQLWQAGYLLFGLMIISLVLKIGRRNNATDTNTETETETETETAKANVNKTELSSEALEAPSSHSQSAQLQTVSNISFAKDLSQKLLWLAFSSLGVVLLISTTSSMTHNVPPIPFLWTLPLALYLATYILAFSAPKSYHRYYWGAIFTISSFIGILLFFIGSQFSLASQVVLYLVVLFSGCMICHGELYNARPDSRALTTFYLWLAFGGVLGSLFTAGLATNLFSQYYEFVIALGLILVVCVFVKTTSMLYRISMAVSACLFLVVTLYLNNQFNQFNIFEARNFYGTVAVKDVETAGLGIERRLIDGYTAHGNQLLDFDKKPLPRSYYRFETGIGQLLQSNFNKGSKDVALIGLGIGALAYYGKSGDSYTFYELNPQVNYVANHYFDFLKSADASINVILGDARIELTARQAKHKNSYDLIVVDAFSSDAIPVHLITEEALSLYIDLLEEDGVLAFHISNSYLDLRPILANLSQTLNLHGLYLHTPSSKHHPYAADWVLLSKQELGSLNEQAFRESGQGLSQFVLKNEKNNAIIWTDRFSSLLPILK